MPKQPIEDRLRASLKFQAYQGDFMERDVCGAQMREAAIEIDRLRKERQEMLDAAAPYGIPDHAAWVKRVLETRDWILNPENRPDSPF